MGDTARDRAVRGDERRKVVREMRRKAERLRASDYRGHMANYDLLTEQGRKTIEQLGTVTLLEAAAEIMRRDTSEDRVDDRPSLVGKVCWLAAAAGMLVLSWVTYHSGQPTAHFDAGIWYGIATLKGSECAGPMIVALHRRLKERRNRLSRSIEADLKEVDKH